MNFRQIKETCLYVQDLSRTAQFYSQVLGLPIISEVEGRHVFFKAGSSVLLCFNSEKTKQGKELPPHYGNGNLHLALECEASDYNAWKERVLATGTVVEHEQIWSGSRKSFYFRDPDQHLVEIIVPGVWDNED